MAANEFEKNVRREMDEFKVHPSEEVWPKIEERIREKNRKRRVLFFVLFSSIALMLGGYGVYNFSGGKTRSEAQDKLSESDQLNDKNKIDNSKNEELNKLNKQTIAIKPNIPAENADQPEKTRTVARTKQYQPNKGNKLITSIPKKDPTSQEQTTLINQPGRDNYNKSDNTNQDATGISSNQQPVSADSSQKGIVKTEHKNLTLNDSTASKLEEPKDTRSVQVMSKKKTDKVSAKIVWGINFSAGTSVITEDAFSFKSSYAAADVQYSSPGNSQSGGNPATGGGGTGGPTTYNRYSQSQNKPAFAFKVGVNARKNISKRSSLSIGLGYSYLADKIKIGTNQAPAQSFSASFYYAGSPQQTHTDHFHFIELPLIYNWRVTNNADHFLSLNAGISPSYLLATNALLYDTTMGGIYYHNKDLVTKAHFNFISGISYQFKNKKNLEFSVGPQFVFDVTKVFKSDLDKRKYFLYTGIDARVFFQKKKK